MMHIRTIGEIKAYSKKTYLIYPILYYNSNLMFRVHSVPMKDPAKYVSRMKKRNCVLKVLNHKKGIF